jgi:hypothetical protein
MKDIATTYNPDDVLSEVRWQEQVIKAARLLGWTWFHVHDSRRSPAGFPDLILVRIEPDGTGRCVVAELKRERGKLTREQQAWIDLLGLVPGITAQVWRPSDWPQVERVLRGRRMTR